MSTYVMSDIHGQYKSYKKMLKQIEFTTDDTMYVLGDAIDRGPDGIKILLDIMKTPNIVFLLGNHELLMLDALKNMREIAEKDRHDTDDFDLWQDPCNGGIVTYEAYGELPLTRRKAIIAYLENAWVVRKVKIDKTIYHLSHAYVCDKKFDIGVKFSELTHAQIWNVVWQSIYDRAFVKKNGERLFPNKKNVYIAGHTFTQRLDCVDASGKGLIFYDKDYHGYQVYNIDCGMALQNKTSQLSCMRLEDREQFYVPLYATE